MTAAPRNSHAAESLSFKEVSSRKSGLRFADYVLTTGKLSSSNCLLYTSSDFRVLSNAHDDVYTSNENIPANGTKAVVYKNSGAVPLHTRWTSPWTAVYKNAIKSTDERSVDLDLVIQCVWAETTSSLDDSKPGRRLYSDGQVPPGSYGCLFGAEKAFLCAMTPVTDGPSDNYYGWTNIGVRQRIRVYAVQSGTTQSHLDAANGDLYSNRLEGAMVVFFEDLDGNSVLHEGVGQFGGLDDSTAYWASNRFVHYDSGTGFVTVNSSGVPDNVDTADEMWRAGVSLNTSENFICTWQGAHCETSVAIATRAEIDLGKIGNTKKASTSVVRTL